jgi:hypothetical protein
MSIVEGSATFEMKKKTTKAQRSEKKVVKGGGTSGTAHTLSGNRSRRAALRREQREHLGCNHHKNRARGKARPITDVTSPVLGK